MRRIAKSLAIAIVFFEVIGLLAQTTSDYDALIQKGRSQLQAGNADLALASGESATTTNADRWEGYALAGGALMNLKRYQEAADNFSKAIGRAPEAKQTALRDLRKQCLDKELAGPPSSGTPAATTATTTQAEVVLWKSIENSQRQSDFQAYLQQYPNGTFATLANTRLQDLQSKAPPIKSVPQARTDLEFKSYQALIAKANDPAAEEAASADFATRFPNSELRAPAYKSVMNGYRRANNADKMLAMGIKVLSYDPDDPEALTGVAEVLARTSDTDPGRDQRFAEAKRYAQRALVTVDTDVASAGYPAERVSAFKSYLRSQAYAILGTIDLKMKVWLEAEGNLRNSIDADPQDIDPVTVVRLSEALDYQGKYSDALKYANQAVTLSKEGTAVGNAARQERYRLTLLTQRRNP